MSQVILGSIGECRSVVIVNLDSGEQVAKVSVQVQCWVLILGDGYNMAFTLVLICFRKIYKNQHLLLLPVEDHIAPSQDCLWIEFQVSGTEICLSEQGKKCQQTAAPMC